MAISEAEANRAFALAVTVDDEALRVDLSDGRTISAPLAWFPRLLNGTPAEHPQDFLPTIPNEGRIAELMTANSH